MNSSFKKKIGDFQIEKTIGEGTFGKVHKGIHLPTGKYVAIKILQKEKISEKQDLQRVYRQLTILRKLNHPHIITLLQLHQTPKNIYIVTEYMQGKQLYQLIVEEQNISQERSLVYFHQLIDAIYYLHSNNICHRDIKPQNIIVSGQNIKIIDFGLSKQFGQNKLLETSCGSPCYAAPEMLNGQRYDASKTDIWALGVTLYAMLEGRLPFQHEKTRRLYQLVQKGNYEKIQNISQNLQNLISGMLQVKPELRMSTNEVKESRWVKSLKIQNKNSEQENQLLIDSMCQIFDIQRQKINRIIETREIPSIFTYYYLMKNSKKEQVQNPQFLQNYKGTLHLQFLFNSLKDIDKWLRQKMTEFKYIGKYSIEYKGKKIKIKNIQNLSLYYIDMPTYFTF